MSLPKGNLEFKFSLKPWRDTLLTAKIEISSGGQSWCWSVTHWLLWVIAGTNLVGVWGIWSNLSFKIKIWPWNAINPISEDLNFKKFGGMLPDPPPPPPSLQGTTFGALYLESPSLYPPRHKVWLGLLSFWEDTTVATLTVFLFTLECKPIQIN